MYSNGYEQATSRSPIAQRNQPQTGALHRMPSRQFDAYGQQMPQGNMYPQDDQQRGYEQPRNYERLNQTMHGRIRGLEHQCFCAERQPGVAWGRRHCPHEVAAATRRRTQRIALGKKPVRLILIS
jgi:hypothetical protein